MCRSPCKTKTATIQTGYISSSFCAAVCAGGAVCAEHPRATSVRKLQHPVLHLGRRRPGHHSGGGEHAERRARQLQVQVGRGLAYVAALGLRLRWCAYILHVMI